jgi:hypothetical protein
MQHSAQGDYLRIPAQHLDQLTSNHSEPPQNSFPSDVPALSAYRITYRIILLWSYAIQCSGTTEA